VIYAEFSYRTSAPGLANVPLSKINLLSKTLAMVCDLSLIYNRFRKSRFEVMRKFSNDEA
jgi:hypothetical protein